MTPMEEIVPKLQETSISSAAKKKKKKKPKQKFERLTFDIKNDKKDNEGIFGDAIHHMRNGAGVHKVVRKHIREQIRVGMTHTQVVEIIENKVRELTNYTPETFTRGMGFPCGVNINNIAAHDAPNFNDTRTLQQSDVIKIDFGINYNGWITDSAFTHTFDHTFDKLLEAVKEATMTGVKNSGVDVQVGEIGGKIQEVMESFEVEVNGKLLPIKSVRNLNGHSITPFSIHGFKNGKPGKTVPIVESSDPTKMEAGEFFAIETFGTTGKGHVVEDGQASHYSLKNELPAGVPKNPKARQLFKSIKSHFNTLPFAKRYLMDALVWDNEHSVSIEQQLLNSSGAALGLSLSQLCNEGFVDAHPPLVDMKGSHIAQFEHTIAIHENGTEILTKDDDY